VVAKLLADGAALDESLPSYVPRGVRPRLRPASRFATRLFARKYALDLEDSETPLREVRAALDALRTGLGRSSYLLGEFTYADILMATLLQGAVSPPADRYIHLALATRRAWTRTDLSAEYADLLIWRDRLYEKHRAKSP